jgi:hypothetical protein
MDLFLSLLDTVSDFTESDPLLLLMIGIVAIALLLAGLLIVVLVPFGDEVRIEDPMREHPLDPLSRSFTVKNQLKRDSELLWRLDRNSAGASAFPPADAGGGRGFLISPRASAVARDFLLSRMPQAARAIFNHLRGLS